MLLQLGNRHQLTELHSHNVRAYIRHGPFFNYPRVQSIFLIMAVGHDVTNEAIINTGRVVGFPFWGNL
jgi:hypothetical protein